MKTLLTSNISGITVARKATKDDIFHVTTGLCPYTKIECCERKCPKGSITLCPIHYDVPNGEDSKEIVKNCFKELMPTKQFNMKCKTCNHLNQCKRINKW